MGLRKFIVLLCLLCLSCELHYAYSFPALPEPELSWKNVSVNRRSSPTHSLHIDSRGVVWVGTDNGLNIYDGVATHPVVHTGLAGTQIYSIVEYGGSLILGTNHGLLTYSISTGEVAKIVGIPSEIRCLLLVDRILWVGSLYGAFTVDLENDYAATDLHGLPHNSVYSLLRDSRGMVYAGTFDGLARWDTAGNTFTAITAVPLQQNGRNLFVNSLLESDDGRFLYVGCEGNLYKYYVAGDSWQQVSELEGNNIKSLARIGDGHLLAGTDNGIYDIHGDTVRHYRHDSRHTDSISDNEIWCLLTDTDRNVWAGHGHGFSISSHSNTIRSIRLGTLAKTGDGNEIYCIHRDRSGSLWLGGTNGILQLTGASGVKWHRHSNKPGAISHNRIRDIYEDRGGTVWLSTDGGINRYSRSGDRFDVFHVSDSAGRHNTNWVYAFGEDGDSYWTGGFLSGVHRVSKSKFGMAGGYVYADVSLNSDSIAAPEHRLENDLVNDIEIDRSGNVWILLFRDDVLLKYNPSGNTLCRYNIYEMTGCYPSKIAKDNGGRIWCMFTGGAVIFNEAGDCRIIKYTGANDDESVVAAGPVGRDMWISTHTNMWRVDGDSLKASILPVPQKAYTAIYEDTAAGKILLGGLDEIIEVDPAISTGKPGLKGIRFLMVSDGDRQPYQYNLNSNDRITIPYGGSLSLTAAALDYSPENVQRYMYKLAEEKTDTLGGWTVLPEGMNEISLTDLKMGDYDILVKRVGMAEAPAAVPLRVNTPVFLSWWAIAIYIISAILLVYAIVAYFRRKNRQRFYLEERKKSLESIERKLTFLSNISHDLKTPLSMIIGPVSLLKEKVHDGEIKKSLETVYSNAVRLNNLIHKTIELQHLEDAEDNMLILSTFDVVDFCRGVFETFKENHPDRNFIFHTSCSELLIEADAVKFESVMTNLLSNACKYSDDGATISCGISRRGDSVEIIVSDDGLGIDESDQPLVFQRMFRAPSTSCIKEGTGLGLYLIKQYLELMNGSIDLYSRKGQGSSFIVTLPAARIGSLKSDVRDTADERDKPKILIVEDNAEISSFIAKILGDEYSVLTAENGRSGLAVASSFLPDLIIADEMMPIMGGLEMCRRMKQIPRLSAIPIIMLTAKTDSDTESRSVKLGIDIFMHKPFEPQLLTDRIRQLLKSRSEIKKKIRIDTLTAPKPIEAESAPEKQLASIAKVVEDNISDPDMNVNFLCEKCGIPQKQLYRLIKKYMGVAPLDYIRRVRLQKAAMLLAQKRFTVSEICYMVGFKTPSYFARCFQAQYGVKPSQYESADDGIVTI